MQGIDNNLLRRLADLNDRRHQQEEALAATVKELEQVKGEVIAQMQEANVSKLTFTDREWTDGDVDAPTGAAYDRCTIWTSTDAYAAYDDADKLHEFLREHDLDHLRKVHPSTLTSWFRKELPDEYKRNKEAGETPAQYIERMKQQLGLKVFAKTTLNMRRK